MTVQRGQGLLQALPQLVDLKEVAEYLRVTTRTVHRWVATGHFPAPVRLGNGPKARLRWHREDILGFVAQQAARPN